MMTQKEALFRYLLRQGDQALIHGHRLSEWCSKGPFLEEDLALANIALDYIGRASAFLKYAAEVEGKSRTEDDLAYKRGEREFLNSLIVELPRGDFAFAMARQLLLSSYEYLMFSDLMGSADTTIAGISAKAFKEIRYHWTHSRDWCIRLGKGTELSRQKLQSAFNELWSYTDELFEMAEEDHVLLASGQGCNLYELKVIWMELVVSIIRDAEIQLPTSAYAQTGSRKGIHTEHLGHLLAEMQYLPRAYPDAIW